MHKITELGLIKKADSTLLYLYREEDFLTPYSDNINLAELEKLYNYQLCYFKLSLHLSFIHLISAQTNISLSLSLSLIFFLVKVPLFTISLFTHMH